MITILLSTYNGEKFLDEQICSILNQTNKNFKILIRDDGSNDGTHHILRKYKAAYPNLISILNDGLGNLGSTRSFIRLLAICDSPYVMFCDQDDFWLPNKIDISYTSLRNLELLHGSNVPCGIFSDLTVVNFNLEKVHESLWHLQKLNPDICHNWRDLVAQNVVTGCTLIINKAASNICLYMPEINIFHDHWIAINISKYGFMDYLNISTIKYRQHYSNVAGAYNVGFFYFIKKIINFYSIFLFYKAISAHFKTELSVINLMYRKIKLNFKRFI